MAAIIKPERLRERAAQIDSRLGPISGRDADRMAVEFTNAAREIERLTAALAEANAKLPPQVRKALNGELGTHGPKMPARDFPFPLGDLHGKACAIGSTHVSLVLPIAGVGMVSVVIEIADAKRMTTAVECAVTQAENVLPSGLGESAVEGRPALFGSEREDRA